MKERKAAEAKAGEVAYPLDARVPGLTARFSASAIDGEVEYPNGVRKPLEGRGVEVVTWQHFKANPGMLGEVGEALRESDFPAVVFSNASGFDGSGMPMLARRASDGKPLFMISDAAPPVRLAVIGPDGGVTAFSPTSPQPLEVPAVEWRLKYLGLRAVEP